MTRAGPTLEALTEDRDRLIFLDVSGGRMVSVNTEGGDPVVLFTGNRRLPDGIVVDVDNRQIYWTNMGVPSRNDGSIERSDLDGSNRRVIVREGGTFTPKQLAFDPKSRKLYWSDREGMRVMRANVDGSSIETLVQTGSGDTDRQEASRHCVGIAVDHDRGHLYWTQKGAPDAGEGRIFRAGLELPRGDTPDRRSDIEVLYQGLPEPIDLDLDLENRVLYWTDRGDPPKGNSVNRAPLDAPKGKRPAPEVLLTHLGEAIGLALDVRNDRMFFTDLAGNVYRANLDGSAVRPLLFVQGNLTGIAYVSF
jgi:DNA-binding beta-propeller fold protein YncE